MISVGSETPGEQRGPMSEPAGCRSTRRTVLLAGAGSAAAISVAGCDLLSTSPSEKGQGKGEGPGDSAGSKDKQAPALTGQVKAGDLPDLKERLPKEPLIVQPAENIGTYGGEWNNFTTSVAASPIIVSCLAYEPLVRWNVPRSKLLPGVARSWEVTPDGRTYTFHLREGMKWSDGKPFDADDIKFAYEDVLRNKKIFPTFPDWLSSGGQPAKFIKVDAWTFKLDFVKPYSLLPRFIANHVGQLASLPKHYLKQFHKKYNPDVDQVAEKEGYSDWAKLLLGKGGAGAGEISAWQNKDLPTINAWRVTDPLSGNRLVVQRNPYYWKTDPDGNQLPYLDKVAFDVITNVDTAILKISHGECSVVIPGILTPRVKPVLARSRKQGGYHFNTMVQARMNQATFVLNQTHPDPKMREVLGNKDFRIGLSYALNRKEIIDLVVQGQGIPWQAAPRPESQFELTELGTQYTEHDLTKANEHLDKAGFTERDGEGFRLRSDGKRVSFTTEVRTNFDPSWADIAEMARGYWKKVGVDMRPKVEAATLLYAHVEANKHDAVMNDGDGGLLPMVVPGWYCPINGSPVAPLWAKWYDSGRKSGEEPPEGPRRQMELYDQVRATTDPKKRHSLFMDLLRISQEEFYVIGTNLPKPSYNIVQDDFRNVADEMIDGGNDPGQSNPCQYYRSS